MYATSPHANGFSSGLARRLCYLFIRRRGRSTSALIGPAMTFAHASFDTLEFMSALRHVHPPHALFLRLSIMQRVCVIHSSSFAEATFMGERNACSIDYDRAGIRVAGNWI